MRGPWNDSKLGRLADGAAAAVLAAALGLAAAVILEGFDSVVRIAIACAVAAIALAGASATLRRLAGEPEFMLPEFDPAPIELVEAEAHVEELAGTSADGDELILDDVLGAITPDARVISLFDPERMPTAGELQSRIERHLLGPDIPPPPDATEDLHDALRALRQSLR